MSDDHAAAADGKLDLVPMIDCVMLLLMFFILTSSFAEDDQRIAALLPTNEGQVDGPQVEKPQAVRIAVLPGVAAGEARIRIGGREDLVFDAGRLAQPPGPQLEKAIDELHAAIAISLAAYEQPGAREAQPPVEIHCATRLPWRCALAVYDAVRGYEKGRLPEGEIPIEAQRSVAFAAPTVRGTATDNEREELFRLEHLR